MKPSRGMLRSCRRCSARSLLGLCLLSFGCDRRFDFDTPRDAGQLDEPTSAGATGTDSSPATEGCQDDRDCNALGLHCQTSTGLCFECVRDADCTDPNAPLCALDLYRCVECVTLQDCSDGFECDPVVRQCRKTCTQSEQCDTAHGCDEDSGLCIECDEDHECEDAPRGGFCAAGGTGCVECRSDEQCEDGTICDGFTGGCVGCRDTRDCSEGFACDPTTSRCVAN